MLYVTTRDNNDAFTVNRCLSADTAPDGGCFAPFHIPSYDVKEITELKDKTFSQIVAEVLNRFFSCRLTAWDVEFALGKNVSRLETMKHKIIVAELWHNTVGDYEHIVHQLFKIVAMDNTSIPSLWFRIAMRIAVLFGIYGQMLNSDLNVHEKSFDVSVSADDFVSPIAAWYARRMGLPIDTIICTYENNSTVWDFIHRGVFSPIGASACLLQSVEHLIYATLGFDAVKHYLTCCNSGKIYSLDEEQITVFNSGLFCVVAGSDRRQAVINSIFRSNSYIVDPFAALSYGGVQDYRARSGESRTTLLLADRSPLDFAAEISAATGISVTKLADHIKLS